MHNGERFTEKHERAIIFFHSNTAKYVSENIHVPTNRTMRLALIANNHELVKLCREHGIKIEKPDVGGSAYLEILEYLHNSKCNNCHKCIPRIESAKSLRCECGGIFENIPGITSDALTRCYGGLPPVDVMIKIRELGVPWSLYVLSFGICYYYRPHDLEDRIKYAYLHGCPFSSDLKNICDLVDSEELRKLLNEMFENCIEITNEEIIQHDIAYQTKIYGNNIQRADYTTKWYALPQNRKN